MLSLERLAREYPLPRGWSQPSLFTQVTMIRGIRIHMIGLTIERAGGHVVTGSAADQGIIPWRRAYFELHERAAVTSCAIGATGESILRDSDGASFGRIGVAALFPDSPEPMVWRYSLSNGTAVGRTWAEATERALWELVERDRVLRAWYGELRPQPIEPRRDLIPSRLCEIYDFQAYSFDVPSQDAVRVGMIFGFPKEERAPLVYGLGARSSMHEALVAAWAECLQRLGFLWGEELPKDKPAFAPDPDFHQEYYLWRPNHQTLRDWLAGKHERFQGLLKKDHLPRKDPRLFADLTPPELAGRLAIAKALPRVEVPLTFGRGHPLLTSNAPTLYKSIRSPDRCP